jgi:hypothetical protein
MSFEFKTPTAEPLATLAGKPEVRSARPGEYVKQRIAEAAHQLSRAGAMAARCELVNEALHRLVHLLYEADTDGGPANVDRVTLRLLPPAPWGSAGWRRWGLRAWEAETLRHILRERQATFKPGKLPPLFVYDHDLRYWTLNAHDYPTIEAAEKWLKQCPVTLAEWRQYAERYRDTEATLRRQYRRR